MYGDVLGEGRGNVFENEMRKLCVVIYLRG
jgi:hypothetical protein